MKLTRPILLAVVLALAILGAATAVMIAQGGTKKTTITLTEKEFHFTLSTRKVKAGPVSLIIKNKGNFIHAFAISGPGVNRKLLGIESGKSAIVNVTLQSGGRYLIWCPMPGHATKGMRTSLTVAGTAPAATAQATTTTDAPPPTTTSQPIPGY
jgi:plastocyanin